MSCLHRMNVTAFSLFGSEESLMETFTYQEIEMGNYFTNEER